MKTKTKPNWQTENIFVSFISHLLSAFLSFSYHNFKKSPQTISKKESYDAATAEIMTNVESYKFHSLSCPYDCNNFCLLGTDNFIHTI